MGTQTMGSQGGPFQEMRTQSLARQGSLYNLTLDEVQTQLADLGKPLGSMNLDELLKSVWTAESVDNVGSQPSQLDPSPASALQRQASLTLPRDLSKKTVDEVWKDIMQTKNVNQERTVQERQPTFGEMTLEAFLMKAGVVSESAACSKPAEHVVAQQSIPQHARWMNYQLPSVQQQQQPQQNAMTVYMQSHPHVVGPTLDTGFSETQMNISPPSLLGTLSDTQTPGRKRLAPGDVVEKTVERRQKRMIKNRESAARSRARKQAYTHELENKVAQLEEENERLRRRQEIENKLLPQPQAPSPQPKTQLRRTSSASF